MEQQQRQVAVKTSIDTLHKGTFVKQEGFEPSYVKSGDEMISRANIIATIVAKDYSEMFEEVMVDDGTGQISVRAFEKKGLFDAVNVGEPFVVIGKVREYNQNKYLACEIIKKVDNVKLIDLRKKELELKNLSKKEEAADVPKEEIQTVEEDIDESPLQKIHSLVKSLDSGGGVEIEVLVKESRLSNAEDVIDTLLKNGDVFEFKPGRIKTLE